MKRLERKFQKVLKKYLTKSLRCDIIIKSPERVMESSLKIEQYETNELTFTLSILQRRRWS